MGFICAITSIAGDRGKKGNYLYAASKAALNIYMSGQRNRLYGHNIFVTTIKLGLVDTKMINKLKYPKIIVSKPKTVARKIFNLQKKSIDVAYVPSYWRIIMFFIRIIPENLYKRINL